MPRATISAAGHGCDLADCISVARGVRRIDDVPRRLCSGHLYRFQKFGNVQAHIPIGALSRPKKSNASADQGTIPAQNRADRLAGSEGAEPTFLGTERPATVTVAVSDADLLERYGPLIEEAGQAFAIDSSYTTDIILKVREIQARKSKRRNRGR